MESPRSAPEGLQLSERYPWQILRLVLHLNFVAMIIPVAAFAEMIILKLSLALLRTLVSLSPTGLLHNVCLVLICGAVATLISHLNTDLVGLLSDTTCHDSMPQLKERVDVLLRNKPPVMRVALLLSTIGLSFYVELCAVNVVLGLDNTDLQSYRALRPWVHATLASHGLIALVAIMRYSHKNGIVWLHYWYFRVQRQLSRVHNSLASIGVHYKDQDPGTPTYIRTKVAKLTRENSGLGESAPNFDLVSDVARLVLSTVSVTHLLWVLLYAPMQVAPVKQLQASLGEHVVLVTLQGLMVVVFWYVLSIVYAAERLRVALLHRISNLYIGAGFACAALPVAFIARQFNYPWNLLAAFAMTAGVMKGVNSVHRLVGHTWTQWWHIVVHLPRHTDLYNTSVRHKLLQQPEAVHSPVRGLTDSEEAHLCASYLAQSRSHLSTVVAHNTVQILMAMVLPVLVVAPYCWLAWARDSAVDPFNARTLLLSSNSSSVLVENKWHFELKQDTDAVHEDPDPLRSPIWCSHRYGGQSYLDLALASQLSYLNASTQALYVHTMLNKGWQILPMSLEPGTRLVAVHLWNPEQQLSILSFRGTDAATVTDILEDLDNHLEAVIFEGMSVVVPVMQFYPSKVVWTVIDYTRRLQVALGLASTETYHDTAARQVEAVMVSKGPRVIVTGHSLGGLVAQVVAAHLGVTGVGISAPGMLLAHAKFGLQPSAVGAHTVNVVPDRDLIPTIDSQMSSVIRVPCSAKTFVDCHDPLSTICELHRACGSHKFKACHQL